jgi:class 3 adenylate cyclase
MRPEPDSLPASGWLSLAVTGHLILSEAERTRVREIACSSLARLLEGVPGIEGVRIISGLAPGADLVLTDALLEAVNRRRLPCQLTAALVGTPGSLLEDWRRRARELDMAISPAAEARVVTLLQRLLQRADQRLQFLPDTEDPARPFQQLAALLVDTADILFAVLRADHPGQRGGAAEVVHWWRHPAQLPAHLRLGLSPRQGGRRLILINPQTAEVADRRSHTQPAEEVCEEIRRHLSAGNVLSANDLATRALAEGIDDSSLRYLYLLSLSGCGATERALQRYPELAPEPALRSEDWQALYGRLHKDLAFAGIEVQANLDRAAQAYTEAWNQSGGVFSAVNAASLHLLRGDLAAAQHLAGIVLELTEGSPPEDERQHYFHRVSAAEAQAVLGLWEACRSSLRAADPLLREDLSARSRTRRQLRRVVAIQNGPLALIEGLALPQVYVLSAAPQGYPDTLPASLSPRLSGSPLFACLGDDEPQTEAALNRLTAAGMRLHLVDGRAAEHADLSAAWAAGLASRTQTRGFLQTEGAWERGQAQRLMLGLARLNAAHLETPVRRLGAPAGPVPARWVLGPPPAARRPQPPPGRRAVGLVFTDIVGFSTLSDADVQRYWEQVVPAFAEALQPLRRRILLQQTWGDALHLVTVDALAAAEATLALVDTVQQLRARLEGALAALEIRVGAHFAPASQGHDAIEGARTYFGSQLSLTARVEPVTPPGTVYVTEAFAAELAVSAPKRFRYEYAGDLPLAKRYGHFRLYSLRRAPSEAALHL